MAKLPARRLHSSGYRNPSQTQQGPPTTGGPCSFSYTYSGILRRFALLASAKSRDAAGVQTSPRSAKIVSESQNDVTRPKRVTRRKSLNYSGLRKGRISGVWCHRAVGVNGIKPRSVFEVLLNSTVFITRSPEKLGLAYAARSTCKLENGYSPRGTRSLSAN